MYVQFTSCVDGAILGKFKRINELLFSLKSSENQRLQAKSGEYKLVPKIFDESSDTYSEPCQIFKMERFALKE